MTEVKAITSIRTRFTDEYKLKHPFACAGLAFAGMTPPLAIAVAQAGGLGAAGIGKMPASYTRHLIEEIQAATTGAFNINFITIFTTESHIDACVELRPPVVSFHWGHPCSRWIKKLQDAGIKVWEQIGSVDAALLAVDDNIALIVVQGNEAGGHNLGQLPLFALLPAVLDAVGTTMVLAAGGIADGRGVAAALALGADGVWVGTRMVATCEADAAPGYKDNLLRANSEDTTLSSIFGRDVAEFNPMRVLRNTIVQEYEDRQVHDIPEAQPLLGTMQVADMELPIHRLSSMVPMGDATGDVEQMALLSGQSVGLINNIAPAAEVMEEMMGTAQRILQNLGQATL